MDSKWKIDLISKIELHHKDRVQRRSVSPESIHVSYGTAGFRGQASEIEHLFFNVGLIAGLRSLQMKQNIGIMITASHNPIQDNGVKVIDANGGILDTEWEPIVERFCNTHEPEELLEQIDQIMLNSHIELSNTRGNVLIGMDTRPSSEALVELVKQGLNAWGPYVNVIDYGLITTPALHYLVGESNKKETPNLPVACYYKKLIGSFIDIFNIPKECKFYCPSDLVIDCANGIGRETMANIMKDRNFSNCLPLKLINTGGGILNKLCGADYVKTVQSPPTGADELNKRYASLDGDADRVVYFYLEREILNDELSPLRLKLLDGDKIMTLYAIYLKDLLRDCNLNKELTLGIVQTAYANGASTEYLSNKLNLPVDCVDTGVKNLHRQALNYDFGIYFEANGHGTICISSKAKTLIANSDADDLKRLVNLINDYVGDAISDILLVETILRHYDWDMRKWNELYEERPNVLIKLEVKDKTQLVTTNAGRTLVEPPMFQDYINDKIKTSFPSGRCFVRPSGTENVARIYSEASDLESAKQLAHDIGINLIKFLPHDSR